MNTKPFQNFCECAENAPPGAYEQAKEIRAMIGETADALMANARSLGLKANNCDLIYGIEVAIYEYLKASNPDATVWPVSEGFGSAMNGPARERVIQQAIRDVAVMVKFATVEHVPVPTPTLEELLSQRDGHSITP